MRYTIAALLLTLMGLPAGRTQTPDDITKLINRCLDLDSIDVTRFPVKYRSGLEPSLLAVDADESAMTVLKDPFGVQGRNQAGAAGWYRISFELPEKVGAFSIPKGYAMGIESNVLGSWEIYTYLNGQRAGSNGTLASPPVRRVQAFDRPAGVWLSNAPFHPKAGDKFTVVILATSSPFAEGSPEGFALRHVRLRFAYSHTAARGRLFSSLHNVRDRLEKAKGDDLTALQAKLKVPLARFDLVFKTVQTQKIDELTKAMTAASQEINDALKR